VLNVEYITVAFNPGTAVIYNTYELAQLKPYLTVTAHFDDDTTAVVNNYTLSGTLATGTSAITATYGGKSAIFTVNVVEWLTSISAVFTQGSATIYDTDSLDTLKQYLTVTATYADSTTATVTDYTLSGTLSVGVSTITVSYSGKTATFNVVVTADNAVYTLTNRVFNNDGAVNTETNILSSDHDFTILCDTDFAGQQTGTTWKLLSWANPTSPYAGVVVQNHNTGSKYMLVQWMTAKNVSSSSSDIPLNINYTGRVRLVFTHTQGSNSMKYFVKIGTDEIITNTLSSSFTPITTNLAIGGTLSGSQVFNGTVNSFRLYDTVLTQTDIDAFLE
jgi:hypothetical protein